MFEKQSMTRKLKRRIGKTISIALSAAMLVTALPADLLGGGVASVKAAESGNAQYVKYESDATTNTTKWIFDDAETNTLAKSSGCTAGDTLKTLVLEAGTFSMKAGTTYNDDGSVKKASEGLSIKNKTVTDDGEGDAVLRIPLKDTTTSVTLELMLTSNNANRWITVGDTESQRVYLTNNAFNTTSELAKGLTKDTSFTSNKFSATYGSTYFTEKDGSKTLKITVGSAGEKGKDTSELSEVKFSYIQIKETGSDPVPPPANDPDDDPEGSHDGDIEAPDADNFYNGLTTQKAVVEGRSYVFDFTNKDNLGTDSYKSDGAKLENSVAKGLFAYKAGQNEAKYHSTQHGIEFKNTNELTFDVASDSYIVVGGNNNSDADITASSTSGKVTPETLNSHTTQQATLANVKVKGDNTLVYEYRGSEGKVTLTVGASKAYIAYICIIPAEKKQEVVLDSAKPDVWDFGAMEVAGANNLLTADVINGFYPEGTDAGSSGKEISSFEAKDSNGVVAMKFVTDKKNHRIRTTNKSITRYDEKTKLDIDGVTYTGYLYSNNTGTLDSIANSLANADANSGRADHLDIYLYEGDTLTLMLGSNGNDALYKLYNPEKQEYAEFEFIADTKLDPEDENSSIAGVEKAVFHAADEGFYQLYCTNEKIVCARITRTHAPKVTVSGTIDTTNATDIPVGYSIIYTNETTNFQTVMSVENGAYTGKVSGGYGYKVTLKDANGYVVDGGRTITVGTDKDAVTNDLTIKTVDQKTITGTVEGLTDAEMEKVKFVFTVPKDYVFEPQLTFDRTAGTYSLKVESGVEYAVKALDVNDFELKTVKIGKVTADTSDVKITFEKKPTYKVTLKITGVDDSGNAVATFTKVGETYEDGKTPYSYQFKASDEIALRDGSYKVKVTGLGNYPVAQAATNDVIVEGAPVTDAPVPFKALSTWDFKEMNDEVDIESIGNKKYYAGLLLTDGEANAEGKAPSVSENKIYLLGGAGTKVTVPNLKAGDMVTITYCYHAAFKLTENDAAVPESADALIQTASGSTGTLETTTYTMTTDGSLTINNVEGTVKETYLCSIAVVTPVQYKETITVGKNKDYETISAALGDIKKMLRTDAATGALKNVTIMIDPGDYEEMLVIDTPNVTLKNASATPSIALKNKGVDIDENAVRVTWYYGHGYTYYSMGSDCKYDAAELAANKANGYASFKNPGSGKTSGSYWNASVVITADDVSAEGIIFENSFNQYMSKKAVEDVIEPQSGAKEDKEHPRSKMEAGDTMVQNKSYVERAAALAIYENVKRVSFDNCKFIGRQDTLYGGDKATAAFYNCSIYGGTDYIFGGMTAVFAKCDLVFNTSEDKNDVGYITAAQQSSGKGYLMYNCTVTSTTPNVDTASVYTSKPGYWGRPWQANTGEAVFYHTIVEAADEHWVGEYGKSLIQPIGWNSGLGGESVLSQEYKTHELAEGVDNSASRASWATMLTDVQAAEVTPKAFLGDWADVIFKDKNMDVEIPGEGENPAPPTPPVETVVAKPTASPAAGTVARGTRISLTTTTADAEIYYTTDGKTEPTKNSALYTEPIMVTENMTIRAIAVKEGCKDSDTVTFAYTVSEASDMKQVKTPKATPGLDTAAKYVIKGTKVKLSTVTTDAVIYYTTNGANPNKNSRKYTDAIVINTDTTIKAIAMKEGYTDSAVATFSYKVLDDKLDYGDILSEDIEELIRKYEADTSTDKQLIPDGLWIAGLAGEAYDYTYEYTGSAIKPEVRVYSGNAMLREKTDYTISYKNNTKAVTDIDLTADQTTLTRAKAPMVMVTGKGNYSGKEVAAFKISPIDISDDNEAVEADAMSFEDAKKAMKQIPVLYWNGKSLKKKTDYVVSGYSKLNGVNDTTGTPVDKIEETGDYLVKLEGRGNFIGTRTVEWKVDSELKQISDAKVTGITAQTYERGGVEPVPTVTFKREPLQPGTDYTVNYSNNTQPGTAYVIITGTGGYTGTKRVAFKINGTPLKGAKVTGIENRTYDGIEQELDIDVLLNDEPLVEGDDYVVSYGSNINVGKAVVTITGINAYSGTIKKNFKILAYDMNDSMVGVDEDVRAKYSKGGTKPELNLTFDGRTLREGVDYSITYKNNKTFPATKQPQAVIKGKGSFKGTRTVDFTIEAKKLKDNDNEADNVICVIPDVAFNNAGKYISKPVLTDTDGKKLVANKDYKIVSYTYKVAGADTELPASGVSLEVGTEITVKLNGIGGYAGQNDEDAVCTYTYKVTKADFSKAKITIKPQSYTGKAVTLTQDDITVKVGGADVAKENYMVLPGSYINNVKKGTAQVTLIGLNEYGGAKTVKFKIGARKFNWFWR
ncbi:MAG: pectinesterase family protein [Butyrivibrio sp.]|nr:pectinesterase family protein [Muribaculum sp.]MCM1552079.1 pectinesterase family protein [Butyrivibrio sp.]